MHWLLYSAKKNKVSREIEKSLEGLLGPSGTDIQRGIKKLDNYLSRSHEIITHAFLLVFHQEDLITLAKYRDQIWEWCTIIGTLGTGEGNLMRMAFRFNPRFVAILPEEKDHLQLVVEKMIQNYWKTSLFTSENKKGKNSRWKERERQRE